MSQWERFMANEPVNEEIADLIEDLQNAAPGTGQPFPAASPDNPYRDLTLDERENLRRMTFEPGWAVLRRIEERLLNRFRDAATLLSESDPLGDERRLALAWARTNCFREVVKARNTELAGELQTLAREKAEDKDGCEPTGVRRSRTATQSPTAPSAESSTTPTRAARK